MSQFLLGLVTGLVTSPKSNFDTHFRSTSALNNVEGWIRYQVGQHVSSCWADDSVSCLADVEVIRMLKEDDDEKYSFWCWAHTLPVFNDKTSKEISVVSAPPAEGSSSKKRKKAKATGDPPSAADFEAIGRQCVSLWGRLHAAHHDRC